MSRRVAVGGRIGRKKGIDILQIKGGGTNHFDELFQGGRKFGKTHKSKRYKKITRATKNGNLQNP